MRLPKFALNVLQRILSSMTEKISGPLIARLRREEALQRDRLAARLQLDPEAVEFELKRCSDGSVVPFVRLHVPLSAAAEEEVQRFMAEFGTAPNVLPIEGNH